MQNKALAVIRHSLAAASAALGLLEQLQSSVVVDVVDNVEAEAPPSQPVSKLLYRELVESKFNLRTEVELMAKFNLTGGQLYDALRDMEEEYVTRTRRSDRAALVGLESRN